MKLALALPALLLACGEIVPQNQVGGPATTPPATVVDAGSDAAAPITPVRVVERRNPFGNLDAQNLVLDGDFEFSGRQGQMPWLSFNGNQGTLDFETGGLCASGVRCGKLVRGSVVFGWMTSPKAGTSIEVSLKARTLVGAAKTDGADGTCPEPKLNVYLVDIDSQDRVQRVRFDESTPAVNGFCTYRSVLSAVPNASPGLYVEAEDLERDDVVLIDDAVVKAVPATSARSVTPSAPIRAESKARVRDVAEWIRTHRLVVPPRPELPIK